MVDVAESLLGHPVPLVMPAAGEGALVAVSRSGEPARVRVAWIDVPGRRIIARVACPPGNPSRFRPVVASVVELAAPETPEDRVLLTHTAEGVAAVRPVLLDRPDPPPAPVGADRLAAVRVPDGVPVVAVDALDHTGEPVGRLLRVGISELRFDGNSVGGHLRATHGMAAGFGAGRWARDLADAAFEAGFEPDRPGWMPPGLAPGRPHVEPDQAYPAAPPAVVLAWEAADGARVLVRQSAGPLASPDPGGAQARSVRVHDRPAVVRTRRGFATLVWETPERAFGVQVRGMVDPEAVALRVARTLGAPRG